jgi:amidophosphoribosyltransferase
VLRALGADARELAAGELLHAATGRPGAPGRVTVHRTPRRRAAACSFEFVYFGHPAATFEDRSLHAVRERFGFELAGEETLSSDRALVVPVPATGAVAARAYAQRLRLPLREVISTDRYHSRTFIGQPPAGVRPVKHHVVVDGARDQDAVLVDDSLVRGATLERLLSSFRRAARPRSVHVRIAAPPVLHPCFYGIDIPDRAQLRAARLGLDDPVYGTRALDAMAAQLGADSVRYLSLAGFRRALAPDADRFCYACLDGDYPTPAGARRATPRGPAVSRALPPHPRRPCGADIDRTMRREPCIEEA